MVRGSVVRGFNEAQKKTCLESWFRLYNLIEVDFVFLFLFFAILTINKNEFDCQKLLQASLKSIYLAQELFLANPFMGVFWGILRQVSQQFPRKIPLIFGICFIILSTCCCYLVVHQLIKPHWNCVSASQIYCSSCCLFHCQYVPTCKEFQSADSTLPYLPDSMKIQSRSLRLYFRNGRSSPYNLVSKTKTNMHKETVYKRRKKNYLQRC